MTSTVYTDEIMPV